MLSDIEDGDESDHSDEESLRPRNSITTDDEDPSTDCSSSTTESRGDSVVGPLNDEASDHSPESDQANEVQQPTAPPVSLDSHSTVRNSRPIPFISRTLSRVHVPREFRRHIDRIRVEPVAPSPSVITAHAIKRVPRMVLVKHAFSLNYFLKALARDPPRHGGSLRHPSPVIEPRDPDGMVLQHCADLHHALLPLEGRERDEVVEECGAAEEEEREQDNEVELPSFSSPMALFEINDADEVALLQPEQSSVNNSDENEFAARCVEQMSLHSLMREFSCYRMMRNLGARLKNKLDAGLKNKARKWRR